MTSRVAALDGLRGIAVLWVVLFHATNSLGHSFPPVQWVLGVLHAGWFGVEIFFALSGFLITGILLGSKHQRAGEFFGGFYWRRTLRIFPIYFLVLALLVVVPTFIAGLQTDGWHLFIYRQGWFWLFGANILREYAGAGTPALEFGWFELTHLWSLSVEEHFYLVWPLLVYYLVPHKLWAVAVALFALSIALHFIPLDPFGAAVFATPKHLAGICVGTCAAMWVRQAPLQAHRLIASRPMRALARLLGARWLVFFGTYSYGLYLYHYLFGPLWRRVDLTTWPGGYSVGMVCFTALYIALPLAVAVASFHWIEAPLLRLKSRPPHFAREVRVEPG